MTARRAVRARSAQSRAALVSCCLALLAATAARATEVRIHADRETNLIYQLDCLSAVVGCSRAVYREIWRDIGIKERDDAWLEAWRRSRRGRTTAPFAEDPDSAPRVPLDSPMLETGFSIPPPSAKDYEVMRRFEPRFAAWWSDRAESHVLRMKLGLEQLSASAQLSQLLDRLLVFHGIDASTSRTIDVHLLGAAGSGDAPTRAEVRGSTAFVETLIGERAEGRLGVVAHEIAHFVYSISPAERRERTRRWFSENDRAWSLAAYNLFNESIAAAFGNGLIEERLVSEREFARYRELPESFYANVYVDKAAKATSPLLAAYLRDGRELDREFVDAFIARTGAALESEITDLAFWLRSFALTATSDSLAALRSQIHGAFVTGAFFEERIYGSCERPCLLQRYPELSGIVLTLDRDLEAVSEFVPADTLAQIRRRALVEPVVVYGMQRSPRSLLFVVVGDTTEQVREGLAALLGYGRIFAGQLELRAARVGRAGSEPE